MANLATIIHLNRLINFALADHDVVSATKYLKRLHKLEVKEKVKLGTYRIKSI